MAYAIKYLFKFESSNGTTREIRVLQDGYTGEVIQRPLGRAPILKKQQNGPVHGTSLEFYAECHVDREFIEFYTSDPKAYRVDLYAGATLLWQGYITPELYSEPDIAPPYDVRVVATDGVGELKLYDYAAQGTVTLRALLSGLLARTGLGTDVYLISSLKAGSRGAGALLDMTINLDYMAGKTCYETLTYILDTLHATITWWKGAWILTRETNVTFTSGKVRYFNTAGNSALLADSVQTLGSLRANPAWPVGQLSTVIDPAKNRVAVQAPWHVVTCLQNSDMGSDSDWTKAKNARYETDGYVLPVNVGTGTDETAVISQATSMAGLRVPMSISVKATGAMSEITARVIGSMLGVLLTYKVGNVTYHLVKGEDGSPTWQQGEEIGTYIPLRGARIDFQQQLVTWNVSRIEAEELSIDNIPPFLQGASFPAGTLTVYILGYCVKVYGATLDVILPKGYQDILRIDNGARGEGSEVEVAIGRETADNAYYAAFLQGLLLDSGNLITSFSDANFPAGMDYLAFIARDYALSVALPRAKVTGTVYLESGIAAPPLVFTKGALNYWLQTWSWNLKEDELEIDALTLPSASLTVESETILESNGSTVSSADSAGSSGPSSSMGVGTNYFELAADPTLVQLRQAYSYLGPRKGLIFEANEEADTNADFEKVALPGGGYALHSKLPFYSDSFISAGGISPGGGASAGNATLVAQTYGGTLSATGIDEINFYSKERVDQLLATAGKVQTVAGVSPTSGDIPVASLKSALGLGAAAEYGIGSVASGNTGLVTGGSVYSAINEAVSSVMKMQGTTTTPLSDGSTTNPVVIDGSSYTAKKGDVVLYDGKEYLWAGSAWEQLGDEASWALKTTSISAGTGLEGGGTLASNRTISLSAASIASLALADSAYQKPSTGIPKTDLASGVQTSLGKADSAYQKPSTGIPQTDLATELSTKVNHGESAYTNLNDWFEIIDGNIHVKGNRGFYSDSFISAGGLSSGGGSGGIDPEAMWQLLGDSTNEQIAASHLTTALNGYLPLAGGTMSNTNVVTNLNADLLDGYHASTSNTPWGTIPVINANGWMDIGKHLEFHFDNSPGIDYSTVLQCTGNWTNVVALPSASGTLALTSDLSAYVAKGGDTMTGSLTIDDPDAYFIRNFKYYYTTPGWARNIVTFTVDGVSKFVIGAYSPSYTAGGSGNGIEYAYIGVNDYNGTNLRFGSDSTLTWGTYSIYHQGNLSLSTLAGSTQIGSSTQPVYYNGSALVATNLSTTYAPYNAAGYLPLNGGTMTGTIMVGVYTAFGVSDGTFYLGSPEYPVNLRSNGTTQINGNTIYHAGNLTKSVLTELLDANGGYYLSLSGGTMSNTNLVTNLNADLLDGYHASYGSNKPYGTIPVITDGGFMDVGKHFEFHYDNTTGSDYSTVLQCTGNYGNIVSLPSGTGTLALTTDNVASATQLQTSRSLWGNSFNGTADINGSITITAYGGVNIFSGYLNLRHSPSQDSLYAGLKYDVNGTEALILSTGYSNAAILFCPGVGLGTATKDSSYVMKLVPSEIIVAAPIALYREINAYAQYGSAYGLRYCSISTWGSWARSILQIYTDNTIMHVGAYGDAGTQINYAFFGGSYDSGYAIRVYPSSYPTVGSNTIWHEGNSNLSTVPWACSTLTANGNITATGAITAGSASDARLKTNIQSLSAEAAKRIVMALNPVTFTWNSTATELYDQYKGNDLGFIAQEVEPYLPQAVGTIFEKYMRLDYTKFITPLISVAQDHETRIRQLERENAELKRRLNMN